ncbi:MAG: Zn-ribbon domain-containing OB-fold protein [Deltaproteobacteria bacterium]|nr:Zn-ribbon domain-containing OB-fold protein [Deltaproteobacteria bacterium]MBW2121626.1 Zn-ribbon domain-containing OB-fold protein [Deltaproteobacteria bacterium]
MGFRDFSLHIDQTKVERFARDLASGRITATRCKSCGTEFFPPRADCFRCMASDMEWIPLDTRGRLATFTMIHVPPEHFASKTMMPFSSITLQPCPVGLLEIEGGLRIMGWIPHVEPENLRIGMPLKGVPHTLPDGKVTILLEPVDTVPEPGNQRA